MKQYLNSFILFLFFLCSYSDLMAQYSIVYPSASQDATVCYGGTQLRVRVNFIVNSNNNFVTITLPIGVNYIPGSESVVSSSGVSGIIYSSGPTTAPVFQINGASIAAGSFIDFTISRFANCASRDFSLALGEFKDNVTVNGSAGSFSENNIAINQYNLLLPSLAIVSPPVNSSGQIGTNYSSAISINNGGTGCVNTAYFYVVNPSGSVQHTSLLLGATPLVPYSTIGDTLFYSISGVQLSADGLLCNGEQVNLIHNYKWLTCASYPRYGAGWGCGTTTSTMCQISTGQQVITGATGSPNFGVMTTQKMNFVNMCTPYITNLTLGNNGTGNVSSATMYNVEYSYASYIMSYPAPPGVLTLSGWNINGNAIPIVNSGGFHTLNLENFFTTDPDGPGGLIDADNDGFFDDLGPGQNIVTSYTNTWTCNQVCDLDVFYWYPSAVLKYNSMCSPGPKTSPPFLQDYDGSYFETQWDGAAIVPANASGGTPFTVNLIAAYYGNLSDLETPSTRYRWKLVLPPGFSVAGSGSPTYGGAAASYTMSGDTIIYTSTTNTLLNYTINLVYNCGTNGPKVFQYFFEKLNSTAPLCQCIHRKICADFTINTVCPTACSYAFTYIPKVERSTGSLGFTTPACTTRQLASSISAYDLSKALYRDTIQIKGSSKAFANRNNLFVELTLPKTITPIVVNKLAPVSVNFRQIRGGVTISNVNLTASSGAASTATMQSVVWNLSAGLVGGLQIGDSIVVNARHVVSTNEGLPIFDEQSGDQWRFFTLDLLGNREICNSVIPEMYLAGTFIINGTNGHYTSSCDVTPLGGSTNYIARRFGTNGVLFQNEHRPVFYMDSIVYNIPSGYEFVSSDIGGTPITPNLIQGNKYTFYNPGNWMLPLLTVTNNYGAYIPVYVRPKCSTLPLETINYKIYVQDYYYSYVGLPGPANLKYPVSYSTATIPTLASMPGLTVGINYNSVTKPDITLTNLSGTIAADLSLETGDLRVSNSGVSNAPFVWIAIKNAPTYLVQSVTDLSTMTTVPFIAYPGGKWYQLSTAGFAAGTFKDYRIAFNYLNCNPDNIKIIGGWNCTSYPMNPNSYSCAKDSIVMPFTAVPAEVQILPVTLAAMPSNACTNLNYVYSVLSAGQGNIIQLRARLKLPTGMTLVGAFQAEYPAGSGNWSNIAGVGVPGGWIQYDLQTHPMYPPSGGLPGTNNALSTLQREFRIRFTLNTDCTFASGSNFQLAANARRTCGLPATGSLIPYQSPPIILNGVNVSTVFSHAVTPGPTTISCGGISTIGVTSTVLVAGSSGTATFTILVPPHLDYVAGSLVCAGASCPVFSSNVIQPDGSELVTYNLPTSIPLGTVINYTFQLQDNNSASCDEPNVVFSSFGSASNIPCASAAFGICPTVPVLTGQTSFPLAVNNAILEIATINVDFSPSTPNQFLGEGTVSNTGSAAFNSSDNATITFYCANASGDPIGAPLAVAPISTNIAMGATGSFSVPFTAVPCSIINNFTAVLSSTGTCACVVDTAKSLLVINVLPVNLLSFTAVRVDRQKAFIEWSTQSEQNSDKFIIERSLNGTDWEFVGTIGAAGNSSTLKEYYLYDDNAYAVESYYRLKQVDLNGKVTIYDPTIIGGEMSNSELKIFPNPNDGNFNVGKILENAQVYILDHTGRKVFDQIVNGTLIETQGILNSGVYTVVVVYEDFSMERAKIEIIK